MGSFAGVASVSDRGVTLEEVEAAVVEVVEAAH